MTYYAGLDVSLRSTHICVVDDQGELVVEGTTGSQVRIVLPFWMSSVYIRKTIAGTNTTTRNRRYR